MIERVIIAGAGGQGVMLLGKVLAEIAMRENKSVTWLPSYGAEVRGGTAHCLVVISDKEVGSPYISKADTLIIMNKPSLNKFIKRLKDKGLLIINTSLCRQDVNGKIEILKFPFTDIAEKLGDIKVANTVALGAYLAKKKQFNLNKALRVIEGIAATHKKELVDINKEALLKGARLIDGKS